MDALRRQSNPPELAWLGGHRGFEDRLVPPTGVRLGRLVLRSLRSGERDIHFLVDPLRLLLSIPQAAWYLLQNRPAAIFSTGGYVGIPVLICARVLRIPVLLWEGNVVPGRSVRATAGLASAIAVSYAETIAALATGRPAYVTGTPIRDLANVDRLAARAHFGVEAGQRVILVFGGSQAVGRFNAAVAGALTELVERFHVIHVTGDDGHAKAVVTRDRLPQARRDAYHPTPFLGDQMGLALAAADLVVGRAGSSTLAEAAALGLPIVVVPYRFASGHQRANAVVVADAGAGALIDDVDFDAAALIRAVAVLDDPATHARMSAAARSLGRPGAAGAIVSLVLALAARLPLPDEAAIARQAMGQPGGGIAHA